MNKKIMFYILIIYIGIIIGCNTNSTKNNDNSTETEIEKKLNQFVSVKLTIDINRLSENEKQMMPLLIEVSDIIDKIFWYEVIGNRDTLCENILDKNTKKLFAINYGPWERLNGNKPFVNCLGNKPLGANFYPIDITHDEFEKFTNPEKNSPYTFIRRKDDKSLETVPFHIALDELVKRASELLLKAAQISDNKDFKKYLELKANALLTDNYVASDTTWFSLDKNTFDFILGPLEVYEDQLFNIKSEHQSYILIKDIDWCKRVNRYSFMLRYLQKALPVPEEYRQEEPAEQSNIYVYDVIYYGGAGKAGGAVMSINFPFDQKALSLKGDRNLQFKNIIKAKFDNIVVPVADLVLYKEQRRFMHSEAYFTNTLFFNMAQTLGIRRTVKTRYSVRESLKENFTVLDLAKARVVSLFLITKLNEVKEFRNDILYNYVTFIPDLIRSIRFGTASPHAKANLICFNYFREKGAIAYENGKYSIDIKKMPETINSLTNLIITMQGDGNYLAAKKFIAEKGVISQELKDVLTIIQNSKVPVDITFEQGANVLGL